MDTKIPTLISRVGIGVCGGFPQVYFEKSETFTKELRLIGHRPNKSKKATDPSPCLGTA